MVRSYPLIGRVVNDERVCYHPAICCSNVIDMTQRIFSSDSDAQVVAEKYRSGMSSYALSKHFGCTQNAIMNTLRRLGAKVRIRSEAGRLRVSKESSEYRAKTAEKGASKRRGRKETKEALMIRAITKQRFQVKIGQFESELSDRLRASGLQVTQQLAVDRYNVDIAVPPFAIEVHHTAHSPWSRDRLIRRSEDLRNLGWHVVYIWHCAGLPGPKTSRKGPPRRHGSFFDFGYVTEKLISIFKRIGSDPTSPRQNFVI